ncbi:MAG: hypothetical protein V4679_22090 [Pseudomonadota bacterium]
MPPHDAPAGAVVQAGLPTTHQGRALRRARWLFLGAGAYGLIALVPQYFMGPQASPHAAAALTHFGFVGVALAWQLAFLLIASDVVRYRLFMLPAVAEKLAFGVPALVLCLQGRADAALAMAAGVDLLLALLFALAFAATGAPGANARGRA